jgi:hypothetical protein
MQRPQLKSILRCNFKITRNNLPAKIETINAKQGVDEVSKGKEINWYQLAGENHC